MNKLKISFAIVASAALVLGGAVSAQAYPVGQDTQILLSKTSAIRSGSMIKVKAKNVDRDCEVTFSIEGPFREEEDFDLASAFSGKNYSTAYTALQVPESPGEYKVVADYEASCQKTGSNVNRDKVSFQVGKITSLTTPTVVSTQLLLKKKPTLNFTGNLKVRSSLAGTPTALAGQKVSVVVSVTPAAGGNPVSLPAIIVTTDAAGNYSGKQALTTKNLKGSYSVKATFVGDKVYSAATSSATTGISIASVRAKAAAAKAAALNAAVRSANITKLTR